MRCPYCDIGVRLEIRAKEIYQLPGTEKGDDFAVIQGYCPECYKLIVFIQYGDYSLFDGSEDIVNIKNEVILFPKIIQKCTNTSVPGEYRDQYNEAYTVGSISPKSSAALSRRLLQQLLRDEFRIRPSDLKNELIETLKITELPDSLRRNIDAIRNIGNFAAHPNKLIVTGEIVEVEPEEADWLLEIIDNIFEYKFISPSKEKQRIEKLNEKLAKINKPKML